MVEQYVWTDTENPMLAIYPHGADVIETQFDFHCLPETLLSTRLQIKDGSDSSDSLAQANSIMPFMDKCLNPHDLMMTPRGMSAVLVTVMAEVPRRRELSEHRLLTPFIRVLVGKSCW